MLGIITSEQLVAVGVVYGVLGTIAAELAVLVFIVWVAPAILLAVDWVRGRS